MNLNEDADWSVDNSNESACVSAKTVVAGCCKIKILSERPAKLTIANINDVVDRMVRRSDNPSILFALRFCTKPKTEEVQVKK